MLVELDYKSFHAQTLAFEAQDPDYLRLAKIDVHSFLTAHLMKVSDADICLGWDDEKLRDYLKGVRKKHKFVRDYRAKRAVLGYGFGMGYRKLYDMNRESFPTQRDAKAVIDMLEALFPRLALFRERIRKQAHQDGYLLSRHGSIRYFWEVFKYDREKGWVPGEDSEAAIAFLPSNSAHGHFKDALIRLDDKGALERYSLVNIMHDAVLFDCPNTLVDECLSVVHTEMVMPSEILVDPIVAPKGLSIEASASIGKSWNAMEEAIIPTPKRENEGASCGT